MTFEPGRVALGLAVFASIMATLVLLIADGHTNGWAVGLTTLAALASVAAVALMPRPEAEPRKRPPSQPERDAEPRVPQAGPPVVVASAPPKADPLDDADRVALVEDVVELVDELDRHRGSLTERERRLADHVIARIAEILQRGDVELITGEVRFDRARHEAAEGSRVAAETVIATTITPGFALGRRVLRRAQVRLEDAKGG